MAEQELDKLLIEVDTQLTSLKGIESATTALEGLGRFAQNASKGVSSLKGMANALTQINEFGKSADGMANATEGMKATVDMLKKLSKFTGNANKSIKQLKALGNALSSFNDVGNRLDGITQISKGVDKMADILKKLGEFDKDASKGISALKDLGDAIQHFNGLDDNVKSLNDVALGLINLSKATQAMQGLNKKSDIKYISNIADALKAFNGVLTGRQYANVANITASIAQLVTALSSTKQIDTDSITRLGTAIKDTFNNAEFTQSAGKITSSLNALSKAYGVIGTQASSVDSVMTKMVSSFSSASESFYKIRENIEAIALDFEEALKPVTNSALFDTLEQFKRLNDSYKNVGGLGQGLGQLLDSLDRLRGKTVDIKPLEDVLNKLDAFSKSKDIEEIGRKFEKVGNLAQPVASLMNALKYTDLKADNPSLSRLGSQLTDFYDALPTARGFNEASYTLNAIKNLIDIAKEGGDLPKDNAITTLADSLSGFGKLMMPNLKDFVQEIKELVQFLSTLEEGFQLNVQPISDLLAVLEYSENASRASEVLVNTLSRIQMLEKVNIDKLNEVTGALNNLVFVLSCLNGVNTNGLRDVGYFIRSFANVKDMDATQLNTIADGLSRIFEALGNIQATNTSFKISLDASGVANFREVVNHTHRDFEEFSERMEEALQNINVADAFNFDAPLRDLQRQLRQAERSYEATMRRITQYQENMDRTESRMATPEDSQRYRDQSMRLAQAREEARQYQEVITRLNDTINNYRGFDFQNQGQALQFIDRLREEYQRYEEILRDFHDAEIASAPDSELGIGFEAIRRRMEIIQEQIEQANNEFESMGDTIEGNAAIASRFADQLRRGAEEAERINQEMRNSIGGGFGDFGRALGGTGSKFLGSLGNLSSMFGQAVQNGTAQMSTESMAQLTQLAGVLGTVATAIGQVGAVVGVVVAAFQAWWNISTKVRDALVKFVQSAVQFSKNMLTHVVGAFNAVAGAVSKVVSAVKSGSELIVSALRKIEEFGNRIKSFLGTIGSASASAFKGFKAILSAVTPRFVKNLAAAEGSLKNIIKNSKALTTILKTVTRYFSMMSRMLMRKSITAFLKELRQAFEDLVLFEKNAGDEMLKLNTNVSLIFSGLRRGANQWIAAFEPLINFFTPMIVGFLDGIQSMGEAVAKFMAILTGQGYYIRAKRFYEDWGQELEDTNKKVKNLTNGLDELNILNDNKEEPVDYSKYFEKVPVDGALDLPSLDDLIDKIVDWLKNIDWEKIWEKIKEFIYRLMDMINEILSRLDLWEWLGKTLGNLFNTLMHAWNDFIVKFDPKLLADALSTLIINALQTIDWDLIHENVELTAQKFAQFWNEIFGNDELWDEIARTITNLLNEIVHYFDTWAWTFDFKQMATALTDSITNILKGFDYEQLRHAVEGWATGIADFINRAVSNKEFWRTLGTSLANVINAVLIEGLKDIGKINLAEFSDSLKQAITKALDGIQWDEFNAAVENLVKKITFAINDFFTDDEFLNKVATAIGKLTNTIIHALDDFINRIKAYDIATSLSEAFKTLFGDVDWDSVFKLPSDVINKLSDAIRGLLNSIPADFNLGTWLAEHFKITLNETDWHLIKKNVEEIGAKIGQYINGLFADKDFWTKLGETTGIVLDIGLNFIYNIFNQNGEDLGTAISNYINGLVSRVDLGDFIRKTVDVALNLLVALDVSLTGTDWDAIGNQIARGIVDAVNKIYENRATIRRIIENAFGSFSSIINAVLTNMLNDNSFAKLGQTIGEMLLGIITGASKFFDQNTDKMLKGMKEFADSLASYIKKHKKEIIDKLNIIIDSIVEIIKGFFDAKGSLYKELLDVIEGLHLGDLLGTLIGVAINKVLTKAKIFDSIWAAIEWDAFLEQLWHFVKKVFNYIKEWLVKKLKNWTPPSVAAGEVVGGIIRKLLGLDKGINISNIFSKLKMTGGKEAGQSLLDKIKKALFGENGKMFEATGGGLVGWIKSLFGKDEEKIDIPVTVTPEVEEADSWDDLFDKEKSIPITLEDPKLGTITCEKIDVEEIYAEVLYLGEIFADVLHVKEIDGNMEGVKKMEKYFGANDQNVSGGTLFNEVKLNGDEFLEKLKKQTDEFLKELKKIVDDLNKKLKAIVDDLNKKLIAIVADLEKRLTKHLNKLTKQLDKFLTKLNKSLDKFLKNFDRLDWKGYGKKLAEGFNEVVDLFGNTFDEYGGFADEFFSDEDGIAISNRLALLLKGIKQFLEDVQAAIDESGDFVDMFFGEDGLEAVEKLFEKLLKNVKKVLKDIIAEFKKFKKDLDKLFEDFGKELFKNLKDGAKEQLDKILELFDEFARKIEDKADKLKDVFGKLFEGLCDDADEEFGKLYDKVSDWIDKIGKLFENLGAKFSASFAGLTDNVDETMSKVYDKVESWTDKIKDLLSGMDFKVNLNGTLNADVMNDFLKDIVKVLKDSLSNIKCNCNCNCGGNCGECSMGGNQTAVKSQPNYADNSSSSSGGSLDRTGGGSTSGGTSGGTGGGTRTGGTSGGGSASGGTGGTSIVWKNPNGTSAAMYANIDGNLVKLDESKLTPAQKDAIARGNYQISDSKGNPLSSSDRKKMLNYLADRGWLQSNNGGKGGTGGGNTGGGTGIKDTNGGRSDPYRNGGAGTGGGTGIKDTNGGRSDPYRNGGAGTGLKDTNGGRSDPYRNGGADNDLEKYKPFPSGSSKDPYHSDGTDVVGYEKDANGNVVPVFADGTKGNTHGFSSSDGSGFKPLYATLPNGERYECTDRLPTDIKAQILSGNATFDLDGVPISKLNEIGGNGHSQGMTDNINNPNYWLSHLQGLWGDEVANSSSNKNSNANNTSAQTSTPTRSPEATASANQSSKSNDSASSGIDKILKDGRIGYNGKILNLNNLNLSDSEKQSLANALASGKDSTGSKITYFAKGNGTSNSANSTDKITDADTIQQINDYLIGKYNLPAATTTSSSFARSPEGLSSGYKIVVASNGSKIVVRGKKTASSSKTEDEFDDWYKKFQAKGYQMGGLPKSGELFISRENGTPEFVGSFGNSTAVANNEQIVTAVANGVSMANDRMVSAIENQTSRLENAIDNKSLDVSIGDRQIAEANNRGQKSLGNKFID